MIGQVVEFEDLQRVSGFARRADVERWAEQIGLAVKPCRGGVWTTLAAMNQAVGVSAANDPAEPYSGDIV